MTHISTSCRWRDVVLGHSPRCYTGTLATAVIGLASVALSACIARAPARIVAGRSDTVVLNSRAPTRLRVRVFDANGERLSTEGVRFARLSGDSIAVSEHGVATCDRRADAVVPVHEGFVFPKAPGEANVMVTSRAPAASVSSDDRSR